MNKNIMAPLIIAVVVGGVGFFGGMAYGKSKVTNAFAGMRAQLNGAGVGGGMMRGNRAQFANGGATNGEVIAKDDKSITIKIRDGGSKIVFFSDSTQVMKAVAGVASDLNVGEQVTALGTANADGSVSAQSIQIRPAMAQINPEVKAPATEPKK